MNIWNVTKFVWQFFNRRVFSDSGFFVLSSLTVNIPFFKIQLQVFKMKKFGTSNSIFKIQSAEIQIVQKVGQKLSTGKRRWSPKKSNKASALQWDALASSPILQTLIINYYTHTHIPPLPRSLASVASLWTASLTSGSDQRRNSGCGTGWLLAGAGLLPLWHSRVSMVYVLCVAEVFFLFSHCTPQGA